MATGNKPLMTCERKTMALMRIVRYGGNNGKFQFLLNYFGYAHFDFRFTLTGCRHKEPAGNYSLLYFVIRIFFSLSIYWHQLFER